MCFLISEFSGIEMKSKIVFNKRQTKTAGLSSEDMAAGPTVSWSFVACRINIDWPKVCI